MWNNFFHFSHDDLFAIWSGLDNSILVISLRLLPLKIFLTALQISIGFLSLKTNLNQPLLLITHQIIASLLIAILSTLLFRVENQKEFYLRKDNVILGFN